MEPAEGLYRGPANSPGRKERFPLHDYRALRSDITRQLKQFTKVIKEKLYLLIRTDFRKRDLNYAISYQKFTEI